MKNINHRYLAIALVALALLVPTVIASADGHTPRPAEAPASADSTTQAPKKLALLVGINKYKYPEAVSPLAGSINDVEDMRSVLIGKFDFPPENILVLKDSQATHAAIISAIQTHLIAKAAPGDIVVFHYSGHGSQMRDVTGTRISGLDETIVPYDSRDPAGKVFDISGAELHGLLLQLAAKTRNVTFILDSCHSGTLVRGARVRSIPADTRTPPPPPAYAVATRGLDAAEPSPKLQYAYIAASSSRENAFEHFSEGADHGALTYFLVRQLRNARPGATYRDIMDNVIGNVTANYPAQHPELEGVEADQHIFGDGDSLAGTYILASPLDSHSVTLEVGQVQGATPGSTYEVYAPGTKRFVAPARPIAKVRLTKVEPFSSEATIISGGKIAPSSRAVEAEHRYSSLRMRVYFDGLETSPTLQSIKSELQPLRYVEVADKVSTCNLQVRQAGGRVQTLAADYTTLSPPVVVDDPTAASRVVEQISLWAKWFNVLSIRNAHPQIDLQFALKGSETRDPMARVGRPDVGVVAGETIDATLTNQSERDLYIAILDLSSDGSISVIYPQEKGAQEVLKPGLALTRTFTTFVPKGRSIVTDILKVFASYKPIDLSPLTQGQIRGIPDTGTQADPLQELLMESAGVTRGLAPISSNPLELGGWTAVERVLVVKRRS